MLYRQNILSGFPDFMEAQRECFAFASIVQFSPPSMSPYPYKSWQLKTTASSTFNALTAVNIIDFLMM